MYKQILKILLILALAAFALARLTHAERPVQAVRPASNTVPVVSLAGDRLITTSTIVEGAVAAQAAGAAKDAAALQAAAAADVVDAPSTTAAPAAASSFPYFRMPVVPGATISGYFDHDSNNGVVMFFDGRHNLPGAGFYFSCTTPNMWDWVGCQDNVSGEGSCANTRELWYDNHHGTDYEYSPSWHTGAYCDPDRFAGLTKAIYAPARGKVLVAGYDPNRPANGWHIRLMHDLNGNGNFNDDNFRSIYLHFTAYALAVVPGQVVEEGQYLGLGGSTGYSSSPHLHFEVQRSADNFISTYWPVDPYGWQNAGSDPYPYLNQTLWKLRLDKKMYIPSVISNNTPCKTCNATQVIKDGGFESGGANWDQQGVDIIVSTSYPGLKTSPYRGSWLAWLGGRDNAVDGLEQTVQIPAGQPKAKFSYYVRVDTAETGGDYDFLKVSIKDLTGNTVIPIETFSNSFSPTGQWTQRIFALPDLSAWTGKSLRLVFEATTDGNTVTSFYIDDVSLITSNQ